MFPNRFFPDGYYVDSFWPGLGAITDYLLVDVTPSSTGVISLLEYADPDYPDARDTDLVQSGFFPNFYWPTDFFLDAFWPGIGVAATYLLSDTTPDTSGVATLLQDNSPLTDILNPPTLVSNVTPGSGGSMLLLTDKTPPET